MKSIRNDAKYKFIQYTQQSSYIKKSVRCKKKTTQNTKGYISRSKQIQPKNVRPFAFTEPFDIFCKIYGLEAFSAPYSRNLY